MLEPSTPWLQKKHLLLIGRWFIIWIVSTTPAIAVARATFGTSRADTIMLILSMIGVGQFLILFLASLLRIILPQKWFKEPRESPNTDYLRSVGAMLGIGFGYVPGMLVGSLFC